MTDMRCVGFLVIFLGGSFVNVGKGHAKEEPNVEEGLTLSVERPQDDTGLSATQYHYRVAVRLKLAQFKSAEVYGDPRLVSFVIEPLDSSRTWRCVHPRAPKQQPGRKLLKHLSMTHAQDPDAWQEEVDLRMYCKGQALKVLAKGAMLRPYYGWRARRNSGGWVARATDRLAEPLHQLQGAPFVIGSEPKIPGEGPAVLGMAPVVRRAGGYLQFAVSVRAKEGRAYVYVRPDQYSFRVHGPSRTVECGIERLKISPVRDFFHAITPKQAVRHWLEAQAFCPGFFRSPGIYEVVPRLDLVYSGKNVELEALTGTVVGSPTLVKLY